MKYTLDTAIAVLILMVAVAFLVQRNLGYVAVWLVVITAVIGYGVKMSLTAAVTISVATVVAVILISGQTLKERYENPTKGEKEGKDKDEKEPEPHSKSKTEQISDNNLNAHLDAGTTILHAFQKLNPEQVLQMRDDTKELMETQKQLVETLSSLGPQVQQGAELVKSFQGMFGGNISEVLKK